ncbi:methyl-accepting chemotaxis protein, partial [Pseudomonas oryzihabitans]|nr:methyl-accepting chemotaxis protein [Pseudomonas oryzihabitans]
LAATAEEMSGQAEQLQRLMSFFHTGEARAVQDLDRALSTVRPKTSRPAAVQAARTGTRSNAPEGFAPFES